jgi:hypothetical protein
LRLGKRQNQPTSKTGLVGHHRENTKTVEGWYPKP